MIGRYDFTTSLVLLRARISKYFSIKIDGK